jgi:hypothetical protein
MSADGTNKANLVLNFIGVAVMTIGLGIGGWFATMVHTTGVETRNVVIEMKATQVSMKASQDEMKEGMKAIVPRNEHEKVWRTYDAEMAAIRTDLANVRIKMSTLEIDIVKLQQKEKEK